MTEPESLIPVHGGYRNLKSFQVAQTEADECGARQFGGAEAGL
jgi:hypothetical protein